jgi:hypothetical protein
MIQSCFMYCAHTLRDSHGKSVSFAVFLLPLLSGFSGFSHYIENTKYIDIPSLDLSSHFALFILCGFVSVILRKPMPLKLMPHQSRL